MFGESGRGEDSRLSPPPPPPRVWCAGRLKELARVERWFRAYTLKRGRLWVSARGDDGLDPWSVIILCVEASICRGGNRARPRIRTNSSSSFSFFFFSKPTRRLSRPKKFHVPFHFVLPRFHLHFPSPPSPISNSSDKFDRSLSRARKNLSLERACSIFGIEAENSNVKEGTCVIDRSLPHRRQHTRTEVFHRAWANSCFVFSAH